MYQITQGMKFIINEEYSVGLCCHVWYLSLPSSSLLLFPPYFIYLSCSFSYELFKDTNFILLISVSLLLTMVCDTVIKYVNDYICK